MPFAVIVLTAVLTTVVIAVPAFVSVVLPFGNFSYETTLALLRIGGAVLPVFVVMLLIEQMIVSGERAGNGTSDVDDPSRES